MSKFTGVVSVLAFVSILLIFRSSAVDDPVNGGHVNSFRVALSGVPHVVPISLKMTCAIQNNSANGKELVPDAPFRALRLMDNRILIFAEDSNNMPYTTVNFKRVVQTLCHSLLKWPKSRSVFDFSDFKWIVSPYTLNGRDIFALVHNEYHGWKYLSKCRMRAVTEMRAPNSVCTYDNISGVWSTNYGKLFKASGNRESLIARFPYNFNDNMNIIGVRDPTNIILSPIDGKFYFMARVDHYLRQPAGECLFRNSKLGVRGWRAWNGKSFSINMRALVVDKSARAICAPVIGIFISSIVYSINNHTFLGVGMGPFGAKYATSPNLISWSMPRVFMRGERPGMWQPNYAREPPSAYYSVIDPSSKSRNFDTIGRHPYLYYVRYGVNAKHIEWSDRQLMRVRLQIH